MVPVHVHLLTDGETTVGAESKEAEEKTAVRPQAPRQPAGVALKKPPTSPKVSTQEALTERDTRIAARKQPLIETAKIERPPQPTTQKSLRTTTVYPGSAEPKPRAQSEAEDNTGAKPTPGGAQHAAVSTRQGGAQPSQPTSFAHVRYARVVKPEYPAQARSRGWEGTTVLKVLVDRTGKSEKVQVQRTSGFHVLDDAAVDAMQRWEFHPARYGQEKVQSWVSVPIVFKLKEEN